MSTYPTCPTHASNDSQTLRTSKQQRLANLAMLVKENGTLEAVAKLADTNPMYLSQILRSTKSSTGTPRGVGDALANRLESGCGKVPGWLDQPHLENSGSQDGTATAPTIGTRLDEARKTAGFKSQSALARAAGVPQPTVHRILSQESNGIALKTLQALAAACNVQLEWLISGNSYLPGSGLVGQGALHLDKTGGTNEGDSAKFDEHADELNRLAGFAACLLAILSSNQGVPPEVRIHVLIQAGNYAEDIGKGLAALMRSDNGGAA